MCFCKKLEEPLDSHIVVGIIIYLSSKIRALHGKLGKGERREGRAR